jgi:ABC-type branched-subunit amino acid transport system ATPase component
MSLLDARGITKRFDGITALHDVSVAVDEGDLVALVGPNGAGKTTLFNCMAGVLRPDAGTVTFAGADLHGLAPYQRARLGLARTFQQIELFGGLTVFDHLLVADRAQRLRGAFWRDLAGRSRPTADELDRCGAVLDLLGLAADRDRPVESLGLGRGRVVELARALVCRPRLLFLDEPSSGLDRAEADQMAGVLEQVVAERGLAILLCEHDVGFVERLASRAYVLDLGRLIAEGPTAAVLKDPAVRAAYLGAEA